MPRHSSAETTIKNKYHPPRTNHSIVSGERERLGRHSTRKIFPRTVWARRETIMFCHDSKSTFHATRDTRRKLVAQKVSGTTNTNACTRTRLERILSDHTGRLVVRCLRTIKNRIDRSTPPQRLGFFSLARTMCNGATHDGVGAQDVLRKIEKWKQVGKACVGFFPSFGEREGERSFNASV